VKLRLAGISAGYGNVDVLHNVDLTVPEGATVALLGANGAGKSTLLKVVSGLLHRHGGEVWLGADRIDHEPAFRRAERGVCLIPEGRAIFRPLTVRDNIALYAGHQSVEDAVERVVSVFPVLGSFLGHAAGRLSGGQQQMLALSRAAVTQPSVVLVDEPSIGLAPIVVDEIFAMVASLRQEGRSLLLVEQYVDRVLDVADYVYILHKGRVVFLGEPEQCRHDNIFEQYQGRAVEASRQPAGMVKGAS
jgi:branched-chain amino acid transport system ATP-binding protein